MHINGSYNIHHARDVQQKQINISSVILTARVSSSHLFLSEAFFCPFLRGKTNYINLGSFLIKPVQRVMRYPLLLMELLGATPESHADRPQLTKALQAVKEINVNINEYKRRKDLGKKKKIYIQHVHINILREYSICVCVNCATSAAFSGEIQKRR